MWDAPYMADDQPSHLQEMLARTIANSGKARDHFDTLYQQRTGKKGKPLYDIMRGESRRPQPETLTILEELLELKDGSLVRLVHGKSLAPIPPIHLAPDQPPVVGASAGETAGIIALDLSVSMGRGTLIEDFVESAPVELDLGLLRSITRTPTDKLRIVRGIGDSMEPKLFTGDMILVDTSERSLNRIDGLYWITLWGAHGLKRLRAIGPNRVRVISENPGYEPMDVDANEITIEGRAIWFARDL